MGSSLTLNYHFGRNGLAYPHNKFNKQSKKDTRMDVLFTCERATKSSVRVLVGKLEFMKLCHIDLNLSYVILICYVKFLYFRQ